LHVSFDDPGLQPQPDSPPPPRSTITPRIVALLEILICSDFPTQVAIGATLQVFGISQNDAHGRLSVAFVVALSLADAIALIGLILIFLRVHGEHPRDVLFGRRRLLREQRDAAAAGLQPARWQPDGRHGIGRDHLSRGRDLRDPRERNGGRERQQLLRRG
jgi:hypothetical protein